MKPSRSCLPAPMPDRDMWLGSACPAGDGAGRLLEVRSRRHSGPHRRHGERAPARSAKVRGVRLQGLALAFRASASRKASSSACWKPEMSFPSTKSVGVPETPILRTVSASRATFSAPGRHLRSVAG